MKKLFFALCALFAATRVSGQVPDPLPQADYYLPALVAEAVGDPSRDRVYFLDTTNQELLVLSTASGALLGRVKLAGSAVGGFPVLSPDSSVIYVSLPTSNSIQFIDANLLRPFEVVRYGQPIRSFVVDSNGVLHTAISPGGGSSVLARYDLASGTLLGTLAQGSYSLSSPLLRMDSTASRIFALNDGSSSSVLEFALGVSGVPSYVNTHFNGGSNDRELVVDDRNGKLLRSSGGVYGVGVWDLVARSYTFWPIDAYGAGVATHQRSNTIAGSATQKMVRYLRYFGTPLSTTYTLRARSGSDSVCARGVGMGLNEGIVYLMPASSFSGPAVSTIGVIGPSSINLSPIAANPSVDVGPPRTVPARSPLTLSASARFESAAEVVPPSNGLLAWYSFDQSGNLAADGSGNGRHLTAPGAGFEPSGRLGGGLNLPAGAVLDASAQASALTNSANGGLSFWFKASAGGGRRTLFQASRPNGSGGLTRSTLVLMDGLLTAEVEDFNFYQRVIGTRNLADGQWHHLTVSSTSSSTPAITVDGEQPAPPANPGFLIYFLYNSYNYSTFLFGAEDRGSGLVSPLNGVIDDLRFFNRPLSATEAYRLSAGRLSAPLQAISWRKVSGPGSVMFDPPSGSYSPSATFGVPGTYVVEATVSTEALSGSDRLVIEVTSAPPEVLAAAEGSARIAAAYSEADLAPGGVSWFSPSFDDSQWNTGAGGLGYDRGGGTPSLLPYIGTNIEFAKFGVSPCLLVRRRFTVNDPQRYGTLRFEVRYDDGLVVYLNGTEVARRNVPGGTLAWNATATVTRPRGSAAARESIDLTAFRHLLVTGENLLAVRLLNDSASSATMLVEGQVAGDLGLSRLYYDDWAAANGLPPGSPATFGADLDGDGLNNLFEYAVGTNPQQTTVQRLPTAGILSLGSTNFFAVTYVRRIGYAGRGLTYTVQVSPDLTGSWAVAASPEYPATEVQRVPLDADFERVTLRLDTPLSAAQLHARLVVGFVP